MGASTWPSERAERSVCDRPKSADLCRRLGCREPPRGPPHLDPGARGGAGAGHRRAYGDGQERSGSRSGGEIGRRDHQRGCPPGVPGLRHRYGEAHRAGAREGAASPGRHPGSRRALLRRGVLAPGATGDRRNSPAKPVSYCRRRERALRPSPRRGDQPGAPGESRGAGGAPSKAGGGGVGAPSGGAFPAGSGHGRTPRCEGHPTGIEGSRSSPRHRRATEPLDRPTTLWTATIACREDWFDASAQGLVRSHRRASAEDGRFWLDPGSSRSAGGRGQPRRTRFSSDWISTARKLCFRRRNSGTGNKFDDTGYTAIRQATDDLVPARAGGTLGRGTEPRRADIRSHVYALYEGFWRVRCRSTTLTSRTVSFFRI